MPDDLESWVKLAAQVAEDISNKPKEEIERICEEMGCPDAAERLADIARTVISRKKCGEAITPQLWSLLEWFDKDYSRRKKLQKAFSAPSDSGTSSRASEGSR